jgi:hypothetical protein
MELKLVNQLALKKAPVKAVWKALLSVLLLVELSVLLSVEELESPKEMSKEI